MGLRVGSGNPPTSEDTGETGKFLKFIGTFRRKVGNVEKTKGSEVEKTITSTGHNFWKFETFVKTFRIRFGKTTLDNGGKFVRTVRKTRNKWILTTDLCVIIVSIVEPMAVGQRTGVPATRAAEVITARTVKRILVRVLSGSSRR